MPSPRVNPKAKIPPWALALIAVGAGVAFYMYKKDKEAKELLAETSSEATTEAAPAELPYEPGYGGYGGGGGGFGGGANEQAAEFGELEKGQQEFEKEFATSQSESDKAIGEEIASSNKSIGEILSSSIASLRATTVAEGSGGGAPASPAPGGVTTAPTTPPKASPPAETMSDITCPNGCPGHKYSPSGRTECMTKKPCAVSKANPKGLCCSW